MKPLGIFHLRGVFLFLLASLLLSVANFGAAAQNRADNTAQITKIEPPGWWIGLTPEVMLLLSGHGLQATEVSCNLPTLRVTRTQSAAAGSYLFVWIKIGADTRSGTAICRIVTPSGTVPFELPLAARTSPLGKFQGLSQSDVLYLIMPDRFANGDPRNDEPEGGPPNSLDRTKARAYHGGDLRGVREHLPYLKDLGVSALWLTPILKNGATQDYHGYSAVDLYAVDPHLGTLRDYQELAAAAHHQGIKIFFDAVVNHVGPNHPWVKNPPQPDWFHGSAAEHTSSAGGLSETFYGKSKNEIAGHDPFETLVDPHAPARLSENLLDGWFFNILPDLNTENPLVAQYLLQNSIWWAESSGLDGYRLDTFPYVPRKFWANWHAGLRRLYPNLATIGEVFHPDASVTSFFAGGQKRFDKVDTSVTTLFDFPLYFAMRDVLLRGAPAGRLTDVLRHDSLYPRPESLVVFLDNHDVPRLVTAAEGVDRREALAKLKVAMALTLTLRGIPQLYYGDEIGMSGAGDPDNRHDFPGGWRGDAKNAFALEGRSADQQNIFATVQSLLRLRREHPVLARGSLWHLASDDSAYVFERDSDEEKVVVAFNNSLAQREMRIPLLDTPAQGMFGVSTIFGEGRAAMSGGELRVTVPKLSVTVFLLN